MSVGQYQAGLPFGRRAWEGRRVPAAERGRGRGVSKQTRRPPVHSRRPQPLHWPAPHPASRHQHRRRHVVVAQGLMYGAQREACHCWPIAGPSHRTRRAHHAPPRPVPVVPASQRPRLAPHVPFRIRPAGHAPLPPRRALPAPPRRPRGFPAAPSHCCLFPARRPRHRAPAAPLTLLHASLSLWRHHKHP